MNVVVYSGFKKKRNSTQLPYGGTLYSCYLKEDTSTLNPSFMIQGIDLEANYLSWNNRWYYIDEIILRHNAIYEVRCSVDVLATYKQNIIQSIQYVERADTLTYEQEAIDLTYPSLSAPDVAHPTIGNPSAFPAISAGDPGCYIVTLSGCTYGGIGVSHMVISPENYAKFQADLIEFCSTNGLNFSAFITRILWSPITPSQYTTPLPSVTIGAGSVSQTINLTSAASIHAFACWETYSTTIPLPDHPQASDRGTWLSGSTHTRGIVHYAPIGDIDLPIDQMRAYSSISLILRVDFIGGGAMLVISGDSHVIRQIDAPGYLVDAYASAMQESGFSRNKAILGAVGGIVSTATGIASGNAVMALSGGSSTISSIADAVRSSIGVPESVGHAGSREKFVNASISLDYIYHLLVDEDIDGRGRPVCRMASLSGFTGYVQCADAHLSIQGSPYEKDLVINYLNSGFFIE